MKAILLISFVCPVFLLLALVCRNAVHQQRKELADFIDRRRSPDFDFFLATAAYEFAAVGFAIIGILCGCVGVYQLTAYGI